MKRDRVLTFRVPAERRVKALFRDEPEVMGDFDRLGKSLTVSLAGLYRLAPDRALDVVRRIMALVLSELEQAVQHRGADTSPPSGHEPR
jgi:hypothetical protein